MRYALLAGGKRLRPLLCLAAAETVGGRAQDVMPAACALEMIHTYSLIHDDLPAMDDDELRRGQPTCHVAFDEATAILAGDALLTLAFQILSTAAMDPPPPVEAWLNVIHAVSTAAGQYGMVLGQSLDIAAEGGRRMTLDQLQRMHALKTGALIETSLECGAVLGAADREQIARLKRYGSKIGLAFQVVDDILNVEGDPAIMGKAAGTDLARHKSTYPALLGLDASKSLAHRLVGEALHALDAFDGRADVLRALATYVLERQR
jgi:geranylgeranyl diphosphate synthase type II